MKISIVHVMTSVLMLVVLTQSNAFADKKAKKAKEDTKTIALDTAASTATWLGKKKVGQHTGAVKFKDGKFEVGKNGIVGGEVSVDLNSITDIDLTDADYNKKLVGHLKSEDFFDAGKFPTATFKIKSFEQIANFAPGAPNANVKGDLTIRGTTKPFETKLFYTAKEGGFEAKGKIEIDRTLYGLKYNSKKFFDLKELGDKLIEDTFTVDVDLIAGSAPAAAAASPAKKI